jgi:multiple sugar transport system substrate-binding protein
MKGLYSDRYAMWVCPAYGQLYLDTTYAGDLPDGVDIGMTNFPRPVGSAGPVTITYTSTVSIPANVENPDAAWALAKYMCIDHADYFAAPKAMEPGYMFKGEAEANAFHDIVFRNHPGFDYDMAMSVMALPRTLVNKDNTRIEGQLKINDLILAVMSRVFNGEMSVDNALAELKTRGDQYIAEDLKQ